MYLFFRFHSDVKIIILLFSFNFGSEDHIRRQYQNKITLEYGSILVISTALNMKQHLMMTH
jgi:hypothetical protein